MPADQPCTQSMAIQPGGVHCVGTSQKRTHKREPLREGLRRQLSSGAAQMWSLQLLLYTKYPLQTRYTYKLLAIVGT